MDLNWDGTEDNLGILIFQHAVTIEARHDGPFGRALARWRELNTVSVEAASC